MNRLLGPINGFSISTSSNFLSGDVALTNANTFYDGPSLTPTGGTYLLISQVLIYTTPNAIIATVKLWNGTTTYAVGEDEIGNTEMSSFTLAGIITTVGGVTYKVSAAATSTGATFKAATLYNSPGNYASYLLAIRIG